MSTPSTGLTPEVIPIDSIGGVLSSQIKILSHSQRRSYCAWMQNLVVFVGPCAGNPLGNEADFNRREIDVKRLITPGTVEFLGIWTAFQQVLGGPELSVLMVDIDTGGQRGLMCPTLRLDAMGTERADGRTLVNVINPTVGRVIAETVGKLLTSDWVVVWYLGHFHGFKVDWPTPADHPPKPAPVG